MSFFKRHSSAILIVTIFSSLFGTYIAFQKIKPSYHTVLFTSIVNQSPSSSESNEQASTYFGESIMGWFRNPSFLNKIFTQSNLQGSFSAHKQERQNLIIEIDSASQEDGKTLAKTTFEITEQEIQSFNKQANSNFKIINLGVSTYPNPLRTSFIILASTILGLILISSLTLVLEIIQGKISIISQVKNIFPTTNIINFSTNDPNDSTYLSTLYINQSAPVLLAGIDFDNSDITIKTALATSEINTDTILIDGDLKEKKLHMGLGLSEMMKNLKGLTDRIKKEEKLDKFIHKNLDNNLKFLAAGSGNKIILDDLAQELDSHKTILIHTNLPHNFPLLTLPEFSLILFIKLGKTKLKTLELIQNISSTGLQNLNIVVVD